MIISAERPDAAHVVAAVLRDLRGRILLARRGRGRDFAGNWEFPGGKREVGETPVDALQRELHEELGIGVEDADCSPLISVPCAYGQKRIVLDVFSVSRFDGTPSGREGQALSWVMPEQLVKYPMPLADRPVVAALLQAPLYLITPEPGDDDGAFLHGISLALERGVRRIQLRSRLRSEAQLRGLAERALIAAAQSGAQLLINGHVEMAAQLGCGVHLRASQLDALTERPLPAGSAVAASCHSLEELRRADGLGVDFAVLGPIAATPTHTDMEPMGWKRFSQLRELTGLPIYALGGLTTTDLAEARRHGAQGIAAIRGLWPLEQAAEPD